VSLGKDCFRNDGCGMTPEPVTGPQETGPEMTGLQVTGLQVSGAN
jgi:hypothetical protein